MQSLTRICQSGNLELLENYSARTYACNMDFFASLNPKLFDELSQPPTQYNLYLSHQNLNIIDIQNNAFVYPVIEAKHTMIEQNLSLAHNPLNNPVYTLHTNNLALQKLDEEKLPLTAQTCNVMMEIMQKEFGGENRYHLPTNFLPSTTLFGLLGGMFLQFLLEGGYSFHSLLLFEEDLDLFRISLYFVDYPRLFQSVSERSCYIFVKDLVHREFVQQYFTQKKITNNFLRLELHLYDSPKLEFARASVAEAQAINSRGWGSYDDEIIGVKNTFINFGKDPQILNYPLLSSPKRVNVPICVVGNGASLDSLLPFIKQNASRMIIFSCGTALKPLKNAGIEPDFQIEIERISYLKDVLESAPLGESTLLCGNMVQPDAIEIGKESFLFMRGGSASAYIHKSRSVVEFAAPYVGNAGFALACLLSYEVLICGLDCGYIKGYAKHAQNSFYGKEGENLPANAFKVRGNSAEEVYSDALFSLSSVMMTRAIDMFKPRLVLNLGKGAYIQGTQSVKAEEFDLREIDKRSFVQELKGYMREQKSEVFREVSDDKYLQEILEFKEEILNAFCRNVSSKKELFEVLDSICALSLKKSAQSPFVGVLFEGSIAHILHTLMLCALHIPHDNIGEFYRRCIEVIILGFNKMTFHYRLMLLNL